MKIRNAQKLIAVCFFIAVAVTGIFPPWLRIIGQNGLETAIGFSSVFVPPDFPAVRIDFARLILLWIIIAAASAAALLITDKKEVD
ncbi:hypothetical protein LD112_20480 [Pantoea agglomerans]|uniref:hypothetical protein n=1 Tax=Enterobacter agglomerans TaxID=549 RepID=UPI003207CF91|nr:hypothetical protein [Pantoea agglomerans]